MTTTIEEVGVDSSTDVDDDLTFEHKSEHAKICETTIAGNPCSNEATHTARTKCCGSVILICEDCIFRIYELNKSLGARRMRPKCIRCNTRFDYGEFPFIIESL